MKELRLEVKCVHARMEAMETTQRRELDIGDFSESKDTSNEEGTKEATGGETKKSNC
jgi:hypothetical protein